MSPHRRPRVLVLLKTLGVGGAETLVLRSAAPWDRKRFDYRLGFLGGADDLMPRFEAAGVSPVLLSPSGRANDPRALTRLTRYLRQEEIHLIHAHLPAPTLAAGLARDKKRVRLVATSHCEPAAMNPLMRPLSPLAWRLADVVVAVGEQVAAVTKGARRLLVVPNGIDPKGFEVPPARLADVPAKAPLVLVVGSLAAPKRPLAALSVFEKAAGNFLGREAPHLAFAGAGRLEQMLRDAVARSPLRSRVHVLGPRQDVPALVRRSLVVLLLSDSEGLPLALLEGAAGGAALLASNVGGCGEVVLPEKTGYLVGSEEEACARLGELLADPKKARALGSAGKKLVRERFDLAAGVQRLEDLYEEIL